MRIGRNTVVSLEFQLTNAKGQLLDSASAANPLAYLHGSARMLPALERALAGMTPGESFDVTIPPDQGFGDRQSRLVEVVPRSQWVNAEQLIVGASVERHDETGARQRYRIQALDAETVIVDANHPLAGETLRFTGKVVATRQATAEELVGASAEPK